MIVWECVCVYNPQPLEQPACHCFFNCTDFLPSCNFFHGPEKEEGCGLGGNPQCMHRIYKPLPFPCGHPFSYQFQLVAFACIIRFPGQQLSSLPSHHILLRLFIIYFCPSNCTDTDYRYRCMYVVLFPLAFIGKCGEPRAQTQPLCTK